MLALPLFTLARWEGSLCRAAIPVLALTLAGALIQPLHAAELQASPPAVHFAFERGGNLPQQQTVVLTSTAASIPYSVAVEGAPWLALNAAAGATPASLVLTVDPSGLAAGNYAGTVVFREPGAAQPLLQFPVALTVTNPSLVADAESVDFDHPAGSGPGLHTATVTVRRVNPGMPLSFTATASAAPWLTVQTVPGAATPGTVRLSANATGLPPGIYTAELAVNAPEVGRNFLLPVRLNVRPRPVLLTRPSALQFSYQAAAGNQLPRTLRISGGGTPFDASALTFDATAWLSITPDSASTPAALSAAITPGDLEPAVYRGAIRLDSASAAGASLPVTLTVTALPSPVAEPSSLSFEARAGSTLPLSQSLLLSTNGGILHVTLAANGFPWLSVSQSALALGTLDPSTGFVFSDPRTVSVSVNPAGLNPGTYRGSVVVAPDNGVDSVVVPVTLTVRPNRLLVPQVADGAGWQTSLLLVNADREDAPFTVRFFAPDGTPLPLPLEGAGTVSELSATLPPGGLQVLRTAGADARLLQGWAEITATRFVGGTVIFRQRTPAGDSEAALSLLPPPAGPVTLPFDNSEGFATAFALLNAGASSASAELTFRDENGTLLLQDSLSLPAGARQAFSLPEQYPLTVRRRGILSISAPSAEIAAFGLRFNPRASFTSVEPAAPAAASGPITSSIPQIADAADWKTTIVLANPGTQPVPFSLSFRQAGGAPLKLPLLGAGPQSEYADTVPAGGVRILHTAGTSSPLAQGSAEVVSRGPLTGVAVFRQRSPAGLDSEGALAIAPAAATRVLLPFNNTGGFQTAVALVNEYPAPSAPLALVLRGEDGRFLGSAPISLDTGSRHAFRIADLFPAARDRRGTLEISGPGFSAFALRFNPAGSFTAIAPIVR